MAKTIATHWNLTGLLQLTQVTFYAQDKKVLERVQRFWNADERLIRYTDLGWALDEGFAEPFISDLIAFQKLNPDLFLEMTSSGDIILWGMDGDNDKS